LVSLYHSNSYFWTFCDRLSQFIILIHKMFDHTLLTPIDGQIWLATVEGFWMVLCEICYVWWKLQNLFYTGRNAILRGICPQIFGLFTVKLAGKHIHLEVYCTLTFDTFYLDALVTFLMFLSRISFDIFLLVFMDMKSSYCPKKLFKRGTF
jgi:hypothetical protein